MKRKWIYVLVVMTLMACTREGETAEVVVSVCAPTLKSADPPDDVLEDVTVLVFNERGQLETSRYVSGRTAGTGPAEFRLRMLTGSRVAVAACANLGYEVHAESLQALREMRHPMAYPDEYSHGMPMTGYVEGHLVTQDGRLEIPLQRMMAKVSLRIDRTRLDGDVSWKVRSVQVRNAPRSASLLGHSGARNSQDLFSGGFIKAWAEADALNREVSPGLSEEVCVYLLENCQGQPEGVFADVCSFLELKVEYRSARCHTGPGAYLIYRCYLGADGKSCEVLRNGHYRMTIRPEGDGLGADGDNTWGIDRSGLVMGTG